MRNLIALVTIAAATAVAVPGHANDKSMMQNDKNGIFKHYFSKIDTDNDGFITQAEHNSFATQMFTEGDSNKDGKLSMAEVKDQKAKEKQEYKDEKHVR